MRKVFGIRFYTHAELQGKTLVFSADPHGSTAAYERFKELLTQKDTVPVILGDLVDRGPDSLKILNLLLVNPSRAIVLMGNHESQCLGAITEFLKVFDEINQKLSEKLLEKIILKELLDFNNPAVANETKCELNKSLLKYFHEGYGNWMLDASVEKLREIKEYFESLPYVLCFLDEKGGIKKIGVHADLPVPIRIINQQTELNPNQAMHCLWARPAGKDYPFPYYYESQVSGEQSAIPDTMIVLHGHCVTLQRSIEGTVISGTGQSPIRRSDRVLNLDFGSYFSNIVVEVIYKPNGSVTLRVNGEIGDPYKKYQANKDDFFLKLHELHGAVVKHEKTATVEFSSKRLSDEYFQRFKLACSSPETSPGATPANTSPSESFSAPAPKKNYRALQTIRKKPIDFDEIKKQMLSECNSQLFKKSLTEWLDQFAATEEAFFNAVGDVVERVLGRKKAFSSLCFLESAEKLNQHLNLYGIHSNTDAKPILTFFKNLYTEILSTRNQKNPSFFSRKEDELDKALFLSRILGVLKSEDVQSNRSSCVIC